MKTKISEKIKVKETLMAVGMGIIIIAIISLFIQNSVMMKEMKKVLGESETVIHEIYDTSKIVAAYKTAGTDDDKALSAEDAFVLDKAREVINEVIKEDMSDYEKEKAIYDWQVAWVRYQSQNLAPVSGGAGKSHTPYGVLKTHEAICVGNATTFKLFMDMLDIPCEIIHSTQEGEHAWDIVQLDGDWYHCDVTFDEGSGQAPSYTYFNVPDSIKDNGSYPWDHNEIPAAKGTKYCKILNDAIELKDLYAIPKALQKASEEGKTYFTFTLKNAEGYTREVADYIGNALSATNYIFYNNAYALDDKTIYCYSIEQPQSSLEPSGEVYEKLGEIISKLTGGEIFDGDLRNGFENGEIPYEIDEIDDARTHTEEIF